MLLLLASGLVVSLFLKERWLWRDEVCSYVLLSDASLAHAQRALVGGIDANPPLFIDTYWLIGHGISLNPLFLRAVSGVLFAGTVVVFYWHMARVLGRPMLLFGVLALVVCLTYLNYTLATQVRSYALLLLFWLYFYNSFRLAGRPGSPGGWPRNWCWARPWPTPTTLACCTWPCSRVSLGRWGYGRGGPTTGGCWGYRRP